jgi:sulfite exporter TauE/SafE
VETGTIFWTLQLTALTTGMMGSLHCLGMCGGISATVALASPPADNAGTKEGNAVQVAFANLPAPVSTRAHASARPTGAPFNAGANVFAFNMGRIASYSIAGALAGSVGGALAGLGQGWVISETLPVRLMLFLFANLMIIFTGLYLMGVPQLLAPLEKAGGHLWRHVSPYAKKLLPLRSHTHAALFGMLWGWIPCGLVYAMLLTAMSAGSAANGALTMIAFGVGTLPVMLATGWSAVKLRGWTRNPRVRQIAGIAVVAMGAFGIARLGSLAQLQAFGAFCMTLIPPAAAPLMAP